MISIGKFIYKHPRLGKFGEFFFFVHIIESTKYYQKTIYWCSQVLFKWQVIVFIIFIYQNVMRKKVIHLYFFYFFNKIVISIFKIKNKKCNLVMKSGDYNIIITNKYKKRWRTHCSFAHKVLCIGVVFFFLSFFILQVFFYTIRWAIIFFNLAFSYYIE